MGTLGTCRCLSAADIVIPTYPSMSLNTTLAICRKQLWSLSLRHLPRQTHKFWMSTILVLSSIWFTNKSFFSQNSLNLNKICGALILQGGHIKKSNGLVNSGALSFNPKSITFHVYSLHKVSWEWIYSSSWHVVSDTCYDVFWSQEHRQCMVQSPVLPRIAGL